MSWTAASAEGGVESLQSLAGWRRLQRMAAAKEETACCVTADGAISASQLPITPSPFTPRT